MLFIRTPPGIERMDENISGSLQENILTLLCFDEKNAPLIVNTVEVGMFESDFFKEVAKAAIDYYRQYKEPPKEHIADILESKMNDSKNPKTGEIYKRIITNLFHTKDSVNSIYVINQLTAFIRKQTLKSAIMEAVSQVKEGNIDSAETALNKALKTQIKVFDRGISFTDTKKSLQFFHQNIQAYPTGIKHLDDENIGPAPGELFVILAPPNKGKTFCMVQIGKACAMARLKVLHISLEMSEPLMAQRYMQTFFSLSKRKAEITVNRFVHDERGRLTTFTTEELKRPTLQDSNMESQLTTKLNKLKNRIQLEIKRFPTGALTVDGLEAFLDGNERLYGFTPDVLLLDYADLMKLDYKNLRTSTGEIYKELRRIAVERNIALVTASQANRLGEDSRVITLKHLAEDYSKAATADNIIAYCQTPAEANLNLARLFMAKARNEERNQTILISQAYRIGQFCMDSTLINDRYWTLIDQQRNTDSPDKDTIEGEYTTEEPKRRLNFKRRGS